MRFLRALLLILWVVNWPVSLLFGTPEEAKEDVSWPRAIALIAVTLIMAGIVIFIVMTVLKRS